MMAAPPIQTRAIKGQIRAITDYALKYDTEKLPIRAELRNALERLDRKEFRGVTELRTSRRREVSTGDGDAA